MTAAEFEKFRVEAGDDLRILSQAKELPDPFVGDSMTTSSPQPPGLFSPCNSVAVSDSCRLDSLNNYSKKDSTANSPGADYLIYGLGLVFGFCQQVRIVRVKFLLPFLFQNEFVQSLILQDQQQNLGQRM